MSLHPTPRPPATYTPEEARRLEAVAYATIVVRESEANRYDAPKTEMLARAVLDMQRELSSDDRVYLTRDQWAQLTDALDTVLSQACNGFEAVMDRIRVLKAQRSETAPIDMLLFCPRCGLQHVDAPDPELGPDDAEFGMREHRENRWTNPPHATHTCHGCGLNWRPSNANTNGVGTLPVAEEKHRERMKASDPRIYARTETAPMKKALEEIYNLTVITTGVPMEKAHREIHALAKPWRKDD